MSSFFKLRLFCVLLALCAGTVNAQQILTLEQALELARKNNLQLKQQDETERIASLEKAIQRSNLLPALDLSFQSIYTSKLNVIDLEEKLGIPGASVALGSHDRSELAVSLQQPVFTGFRLRSKLALAQNNLLTEEAKADELFNQVCYQVHAIFYAGEQIANQEQIQQASLERLRVQLQNIRNLFESEQVLAFDTLQVYNQMLSVNIELENARLAKRLNNLRLAQLLDLKEKVEVAPPALPAPEVSAYQEEEALAEAREKRPELASLRLAQHGVALQEKIARSTYLPTIYAQGAFHYAKPGLDPIANEWMDYFTVGVNLQWNLWRWGGDRYKVEQLQVSQNRLSLQEQALVDEIEFQVRESRENLDFSFAQLQLAEQLRAQQEERYRIVSTQHENGVATTNDMVTAETDLTRAELQKQQALVRYYLNLADLKLATGSIGEF